MHESSDDIESCYCTNQMWKENVLSAHTFYEEDSCYEEPLLSSFWGAWGCSKMIPAMRNHIWEAPMSLKMVSIVGIIVVAHTNRKIRIPHLV